MGGSLVSYTVQESVLFMAREAGDLPGIIKATEALLKTEGFDRLELTSPIQWIGELEDIRGVRIKAQAFGGSFVALLIVLIFGSIAVFEYRQNVFATALFKSFGLHSVHLALRYLADSLFWLLLSYYLALELAQLFHTFVFKAAGFDLGLLDLSIFNPYQFADNQVLLLVLLIASFVAVIPVCLALRKPIGKVLG
jgi:CDP-diglyceride synthetase